MRILSCDPGLKGGFCLLDSKTLKLDYQKMPLLKNGDYDIITIIDLIKSSKPDFIFHEKVRSLYGMSAKSNFSFGRGVGITESHCLAYGKPFQEVPPKEWQKVAWKGIDKVKDPKKNSLVAAQRLFPSYDFLATKRSSVPHDGIIDATLIAWYGKITLGF